MPSEFVTTVLKTNLSTFYLLPLIYLNKFSFGQGNFIESYVNSSGTTLIVDVALLQMCHKDCLASPYLSMKSDSADGYSHLIYCLPPKWHDDFLRFKAGKFSEFSEEAKHLIREYSGLMVNMLRQGVYITDPRIRALDKSPLLREIWEIELACLPLPEDLELMPVPPERVYRDILL